MNLAKRIGWTAVALAALAAAASAQTAPKVDYGKVLGTWTLTVSAGEENYYLSLELKMTEGKLGGFLSEQNGLFTNTPVSAAEFDGQTLKFESKTPTPPDGMERVIKTEAKLVDGKLEGMLTVPELGVAAGVAGVRKQ